MKRADLNIFNLGIKKFLERVFRYAGLLRKFVDRYFSIFIDVLGYVFYKVHGLIISLKRLLTM